jgi:hypothetical protein
LRWQQGDVDEPCCRSALKAEVLELINALAEAPQQFDEYAPFFLI